MVFFTRHSDWWSFKFTSPSHFLLDLISIFIYIMETAINFQYTSLLYLLHMFFCFFFCGGAWELLTHNSINMYLQFGKLLSGRAGHTFEQNIMIWNGSTNISKSFLMEDSFFHFTRHLSWISLNTMQVYYSAITFTRQVWELSRLLLILNPELVID